MREDGQQVRAGQEVRIIDVPADAGAGLGAWQDLHGHDTPGQFSDAIKAACASNYGTLSRAFIDELIRRRDELNLRQGLDEVVSAWMPSGSSGQVRRVVARFALTGLAGEYAASFGLAPWAKEEALNAAKQCLEVWLDGRGNSGDQEDSSAVEMVWSFIGRFGGSRFQNIDKEVQERIPDRAGFRRKVGEQVQFLFTKEQFRAMLTGLNPIMAAKALARAGLLRRNDRNLTIQVTLPDLGKVRVYAVTLPDDDGGQPC
jgi:putative DNA primase/helicase